MLQMTSPLARRWLTLLGAVGCVGLAAITSTGTAAPTSESASTLAIVQDDSSQESVAVVTLEHASCDDMARVLREMVPEAQVSFDPRTNAIIVKATDRYHRMVRSYIEQLDRPLDERPEQRRVEVIRFANTSLTPGIQRALIEMFGGRDVKISLDPDRNTVVIEAPGETLERVKALVQELDRRPEQSSKTQTAALGSYRVRIVWLVTGAADDAGGTAVPADLQPVVDELNKLGVKNLKIAAQMLTRVRMNQQFSVHATPTLNQRVQLESAGTLLAHGNDRPELRIEVEARSESPAMNPQGPAVQRPETLAALRTTIDAPVGHFVVLGVTPIGAMTSVFVVQLQPGEQEAADNGERRVW